MYTPLGHVYNVHTPLDSPWPRATHLRVLTSVDATCQVVFDTFDADKSGAVDAAEVGAILKQLGIGRSALEVAEIVKECDADGSGEIEFDEFCTVMGKQSEFGGGGLKAMLKADDPDEMRVMLRNACEEMEEVDIIMQLRGENVEPQVRAIFAYLRVSPRISAHLLVSAPAATCFS